MNCMNSGQPRRHAVAGIIALLPIALFSMGNTECPFLQPEPYLKTYDLHWTFFTGIEPTSEVPKKLGSIRLDNLLDQQVWYVVEDLPSPYQIKGGLQGVISPMDIGYLKMQTVAPLDADDTVQLPFTLGLYRTDPSLGGNPDQRASVSMFGNLRSDTTLLDMEEIMRVIRGETYVEEVPIGIKGLPLGLYRFNSNPLLAALIPEPEVEGIGRFRSSFELENIGLTFNYSFKQGDPLFPCGDGPNGYTVCPDISATLPEDAKWQLLAQIFDADVPLNDAANYYQFGFVFDADGNPDNNYVPLAQYANDYYQGTDLWYSVEYSPSGGWHLVVTDARNNAFTAIASAARAIILGNTIALVVPHSEFSATEVWFRLTSFRHSGDYGQNPPYDWSSDYHPMLDELTRLRLK